MKHVFAFGVLGALVACGGHGVTSSPRTTPSSTGAARQREVASPRVCLGKRRILEALGNKELATAAARPSDRVELEPARPRGVAPAIEHAYGVAAPATVLIKTRDGMGSGVIIDARRGLVLTNHHVIDDLLGEDLTIHVTLELGKTLPAGRVVASDTKLEGVVVKTDAVKDLAIVKIIDPPKQLAQAQISEFDPRVGETVMSIGNAGIGLTWAAKVCNVSKIGDATRETSMLEVGDCTRDDPTATEDDRRRHREQCQARKEEIKRNVEQSPQALSVQTTCSVNGGDSGGPLVNAWGEIVGLNQSVRFGANTLAFHVHVAEIRELVKDVPDTAVAVIPDPFCESGAEVTVEDFDGDGVFDATSAAKSMAFEGGQVRPQGVFLFDLDEDSTKGMTADRPFDPEVALVLERDDAFAFYDTDGDGELDVMLRDDQADGTPERAYRIAHGQAKPDRSLLSKKTLDPSLVPGGSLQRFGAVAVGLGHSKLTTRDAIAAADTPRVPDFARSFGDEGYAQDSDGDGTVETIYARQNAGMAVLFDVRSKVLGGLKSGDAAAPALKTGQLHPQYVYFDKPAGAWALYDTDADGNFDLALFSKRPQQIDGNDRFSVNTSYATHAFAIASGKPPVAIKDPVGRSLSRPDLFRDAAVKKAFLQGPTGRSDQRGGFPDPLEGATGQSEPWHLVALDHDRQVLEQTSRLGHVVVVDLDRDTKKLATRTPSELAKPGELDAELAIVRDVEAGWFYYDTDRDGAYDTVLYTRDFAAGQIDNAFKLDPTGEKVTVLAMTGPAFRPELVKASGKAREKLTAIVDSMKASIASTKGK
ncbi:MAG TPA: trypsin-like peptidase domain-containing protein [Kofleriaceae bacterium]|nr:trypsin-like peptidase domain-containing protein [Kofleriaceae bacterium]